MVRGNSSLFLLSVQVDLVNLAVVPCSEFALKVIHRIYIVRQQYDYLLLSTVKYVVVC